MHYPEVPESPNAHGHPRFSPYPGSTTGRSRANSWRGSPHALRELPLQLAPSFQDYNSQDARVLPPILRFGPPGHITLAPIVPPESQTAADSRMCSGDARASGLTLPPISALDASRHGIRDDPSAVLRRLRSMSYDDDLPSSSRGSRDADASSTDYAASGQTTDTPVQSHNITHIKPDAPRSPSVRNTSFATAPDISSGSVSTPSPYFSASSARSGSTTHSPVSPITPPSYAPRSDSDARRGSHYYIPSEAHGGREAPSATASSRRRDSDDMEKRSGDYHNDTRMEHGQRVPAIHAENHGWGGHDHPADPTNPSWRAW